MSTALHLCSAEDAPVLFDLMARYATEHQLSITSDQRVEAVAPLLDSYPYGMAYLFGPRRAPLGYAVLTVSYSIVSGGIEATVDEMYLRDAVRGRGLPAEILHSLATSLKANGVKALHMDVQNCDPSEKAELSRAAFAQSSQSERMTRTL